LGSSKLFYTLIAFFINNYLKIRVAKVKDYLGLGKRKEIDFVKLI